MYMCICVDIYIYIEREREILPAAQAIGDVIPQ